MARGSTNALGKLPIIVNPNLLENWYFGGAEIWAKSGAPYHKDDGTQIGTLSSDVMTKNNPNSSEWPFVIVDGAQYQVHAYYCYQKQGTGPVNQRGKAIYTTVDYAIDRWRTWDAPNGFMSVETNGIRIMADAYHYFSVEESKMLDNKQMTVSLLTANGKLYFKTFTNSKEWHGIAINENGINNLQFINDGEGYMSFVRIIPASYDTYSELLLAVKLELGDTQTLAHQDASGNWVLNEIPNYGEQLARCQRYVNVLRNTNPGLYGVVYNPTTLRVFVPLPVPMRATPALSVDDMNQLTAYSNGATSKIGSITAVKYFYGEGGIGVDCSLLSELTTNHPVVVRVNTPVLISSDL